MPRFTLVCLLAACGLSAAFAAPAVAYYDDVHYVLTYYVARQIGYTHEQAFRLASADVSIDWDPETEPVQGGPKSMYVGITAPQKPRWKFHAFRNEIKFKDNLIGASAANGPKADDDIKQQRVLLWVQGLDDKNLGAFLHSFQDEVPHGGYASFGGHWPFFVEPSDFRRHAAEGLPVGGTTDWLTYRDMESNLQLARSTAHVLTRFMQIVSPLQQPYPLDEAELQRFLQGLRDCNLAPPPLEGDVLTIYPLVFAKPDLLGQLGNRYNLSVEQNRDIEKHMKGTDLPAALAVLKTAIGRNKMLDRELPEKHRQYNYNDEGRFEATFDLTDTPQHFTIVSNVTVRVKRKDVNGIEHPYERGAVQLRMAKTPPGVDGYVLGEKKPIGAGGEVKFENIPVGDIKFEVFNDKDRLVSTEEFFVESKEDKIWLEVGKLTITRDLDAAKDSSYGANVDLVVVFDTTGSMQSSIDSIRNRAIETIRFMGKKSHDLRLGIVSFRDQADNASTAVKAFGFSRDIEAQINLLLTFKAEKGGDKAEDQYAGIMAGIDMWKQEQASGAVAPDRPNVVKLIVVITDAPAKYPDFQGNTPERVAAEAEAVDPAHIYPIIVGHDPQALADGQKIAELTGGKMLTAESGDHVADALLEAVEMGVKTHSSPSLGGKRLLPTFFWAGIAAVSLGLVLVVFPNLRRRNK